MPNRTAKFVSAIFASVLAGIALSTTSYGATPAADDCLSGPKDQAPQGSHWYYRIDRATKRHCWYLRGERETVSQITAPNASPAAPAAKPVAPNTGPAMQRSIADAHAELNSPQTPGAQDTGTAAAPLTSAPAGDTTNIGNIQPANARDANTQRSAIASRWPDQSDASSSADPGPTESNPDATVQAQSDAAPPTAFALTVADSSSEKTETGSLRMLLLIIIGALSVAGLMGSAIFRFGSLQRIGRRDIRGDRRSIWDPVSIDHLSPPAFANSSERRREVCIPRELAAADDPDDGITEMLARLARSAKI
jgi:hypothetical protein